MKMTVEGVAAEQRKAATDNGFAFIKLPLDWAGKNVICILTEEK